MEMVGYFYTGGLPELGKPHLKAGYRWCVGFAEYEDGKVRPWRENLGHNKLLAQYRAREMTDMWATHIDDYLALSGLHDPEQAEIPALNRKDAKRLAWDEAEEAMAAPSVITERINLQLRGEASGQKGPAISPGFKIVPVPISTIESQPELPNTNTYFQATSSVRVMLHRAADMWLVALRQRLEVGDISDSYVERAAATIRRFKKLIPDMVVAEISKPHLDMIRLRVQSRRKLNGDTQKKGTIKTDLGCIRTFFEWLVECEMWSSRQRWGRWLRPVFRHDDYDEDADKSSTVVRYTFAEIVKIYAAASRSTRLWMLLALNFAWGAKEIDTARCNHFKRNQQRVARFRHKRAPNAEPIPGRWIAWPETWLLALERIEARTANHGDSKAFAFLSRPGQRLVRYQRGRRYDVPADALREACEKAGVKFRGFYGLRRSAINFVKKIGKRIDGEAHGKLMADLFCQHGKRDMTERYLDRDWRALFKVIRILRRRLQPMFDAAEPDRDHV